MTSVCAAQPSYIVLPEPATLATNPPSTVQQFLIEHFVHIEANIWYQRIFQGKVHWQNGELINESTVYRPKARVYYYREVEKEIKVPFEERIIYQDDEIIIVFKPHFLPVTPSGHYVNECLVHRLRIKTGIETIAPAHRLDKDTAGIMLMTLNPKTRHHYHSLFTSKQISKNYQAIAALTPELLALHQTQKLTLPIHWTVKNCIKRSKPSFIMQVVDDEANSHSEIGLMAVKNGFGLFELSPITGKTHQLRLHMNSLNMPILNDKFYPKLKFKMPETFQKPLQLLAHRLKFTDPVTKKRHDICHEGLSLDAINCFKPDY